MTTKLTSEVSQSVKFGPSPAPWILSGNSLQIWGNDSVRICEVDSYNEFVMNRVAVANANLIAAAPELLEACKLALANINNLYPEEHLVKKSLKAAIHKATTESL